MPEIKSSAVILAAGLSTRMGTSKLSLPWGNGSVIGAVCSTLFNAGVGDLVVVIGGYQAEVRSVLDDLPFSGNITMVTNPDPAGTGMLGSVKTGLRAIAASSEKVLIALGDNPQITTKVVQNLMAESGGIVIPSHQMRRGHPWSISREVVSDLLALPDGATMRDWINARSELIKYIDAGPEILMDLDTPQDYERQKP